MSKTIASIYPNDEWKERIRYIEDIAEWDWDGFYPVVDLMRETVVDIIPADSVPANASMLDEDMEPTTDEAFFYAIDGDLTTD